MPIPGHHTFNTLDLTAYTPSCGTTPVAAYTRSPLRGTVRKFTGILGGVITAADCTVTVANVTQGTTVGTFTMSQAGSAAGLLFSGTPSSLVNSQVNEDDVLSFTPAGATGTSIPAHFCVAIREG